LEGDRGLFKTQPSALKLSSWGDCIALVCKNMSPIANLDTNPVCTRTRFCKRREHNSCLYQNEYISTVKEDSPEKRTKMKDESQKNHNHNHNKPWSRCHCLGLPDTFFNPFIVFTMPAMNPQSKSAALVPWGLKSFTITNHLLIRLLYLIVNKCMICHHVFASTPTKYPLSLYCKYLLCLKLSGH
jgi:hypothetical protein